MLHPYVRSLLAPALVAVAVMTRPAPARAEAKVEVSMICPVVAVQAAEDGGVDVVIGRGAVHGLVPGTPGNVYEPGETSGVGAVVGRLVLTEVGEAQSRGHVAPSSLARLERIVPGASVDVNTRVDAGTYQGLLLGLALNGIVFLDNTATPIVTLEALLGARDGALEQRALEQMVVCGHEVIEFTLELKNPVTRGKWKGRVMADVLRDSAPDDYRAFLRFVRDFPGKYIGKPWKISETYATWILNDTPPSEEDRLTELLAAKGRDFTDLAREQTESELVGFLSYHRRAITNFPDGRVEEGWRILRTLERAVKARPGKPSAAVRAELLHMRARLLARDPKKTTQAAKAYGQLATLYFETGDHIEAFVALNNVVSQSYAAERYDEVLKLVPETLAVFRAEKGKITDPQIAAHVPAKEAFLIRLAADISRRRGQYREVVEQLTPLVGTFEAVGYPSAREDEMNLIKELAGAHTKLGEFDQARVLYTRMEALAERVDDDAKRADLAWEIGELHWQQSRWVEAAAEYDRMARLAAKAGRPALEAKALAAAGQSLWNVGQHAEALAKHAQGLALREQVGDQSGLAWQLVQMGKILVETGDRDKARDAFERALGIRRALGERSKEAEVLEQLGALDKALTRLDAARARFDEARAIYAKLKLVPDEARVLQSIAGVELKEGAFREAATTIAKSVGLFKRIGDSVSLVVAMYWQGRVLSATGAYAEARRIHERAIALSKDDKALKAEGVTNLGALDLGAGELDRAATRAQEALALAESAQDVTRQVGALGLLEDVQEDRADFDGALVTNARRLTLARESGNRPAEVSALVDRAWKLVDIGRLADARKTLDDALPISRQNGDDVELAWVLNGFAKVHEHLGDAGEEMKALDAAVVLMERAKYPYGIAAMVFNRSLLFTRLRDLDRALADSERAEKIGGDALDVQFRIPLLSGRGSTLRYMKRFVEAEKTLQEALALARTAAPGRVPALLRELGRLQEERGKIDAAVETLREAAELSGKMAGRQYASLAELGIVLAVAGRDDEAAPALEEAVARARERGGKVPWEALYQLGMLRARQGKKQEAIALLHASVDEVERGEVLLADDAARMRYRADKTGVYRYLIKLLLEDGKVEGALRYLERSKVSELAEVDRRTGSRGDPATALAIELDVQEARLQGLLDNELQKDKPDDEKVSRLDGLLASVKKRRAAFAEKLDRNDALFDRYAVRPLQLEKLQQYLDDDMLVLAPVILDDQVVVFAVTKSVLTHYVRPAKPGYIAGLVQELARLVHPDKARGALGVAGLKKARKVSGELYDMLVRPAFEAIGRPKRLIVSASGALRYVPFAALWDGEAWLVERSSVVNVTALDREKFAERSPRGRADATVLALADPDGSLPGARLEVAEVQKALPAVDVFEGKAATLSTLRTKLRVPGYDIVHLATHGRLDTEQPERSNILLAGDELSYADIPTLSPSRTHLVILSACETAVNAGGTGVEIAGLAYQFQRSKVDSVLATLWQVDDEATAELMSRLYGGLAKGSTYVDALADAQRGLIGDADSGFDHPAYWAAFFLMGSP
ncbi:MAG: CHAT domain-containing protein [Deltaproteobacteria bacterium]|nr:MAG: CHAT domain-containing protein [Deltaproteobacteria bacterium]